MGQRSDEKPIEPVLAGELSRIVVEKLQSNTTNGHREDELTPRQREILILLAQGKTVKEIAGTLLTSKGDNVSVKTVEAHKHTLMRKLNIHNKAALIRYAYQNNLMNTNTL